MRMARRRFVRNTLLLLACSRAQAGELDIVYPDVTPGRALTFPRDFGSHPEFRTEWWYITGWLEDERAAPLGVQITFFRHRPGVGEGSASRFAPQQLVFAHAAIADPAFGRLRHDQRVARAGFGLAQAAEATTDVRIDDWSLQRLGNRYAAVVRAKTFSLDLSFAVTQPPLLEGEQGFSRKGPDPKQASYYYSEPHLAVRGAVVIDARRFAARGVAWCDHEWSSEYLATDAAGWDWTGIDLDDGGAVMAFVMRRKAGGTLWAGGTVRARDGTTRTYGMREVVFEPRRTWRSPRTQATYPIATRIIIGDLMLDIEPLMDDQELDARVSTGTVYWEGAVRALRNGEAIGRGYLELTGYAGSLRDLRS